jgi:cytochrome c oxidase subunit 2
MAGTSFGFLSGPLSALDAAGPGAQGVAQVWWAMFWGGMALLALMTALGSWAALRSHRRVLRRPMALLAAGGIVLPTAVLVALLAHELRNGSSLVPLPLSSPVTTVGVEAYRAGWRMRQADGSRTEGVLHIPAGRPVDVRVTSADVIHSFWVPRLGGKIDAIPGRTNVIRLQADAPGTYQGQCAEFCGYDSHSRMPFTVEAHADDASLARALAAPPAAPPAVAVPAARPGASPTLRPWQSPPESADAAEIAGGRGSRRLAAPAAPGTQSPVPVPAPPAGQAAAGLPDLPALPALPDPQDVPGLRLVPRPAPPAAAPSGAAGSSAGAAP